MLHYYSLPYFNVTSNGPHQFTVTSSVNNSIGAFQEFLRYVIYDCGLIGIGMLQVSSIIGKSLSA